MRWYPLALAGIIAAGVILRLYGISGHFLTYDESFSALLTRVSLPKLMAATAGDVHPPLSYLLAWVVTGLLGTSPLTLRLPSSAPGRRSPSG